MSRLRWLLLGCTISAGPIGYPASLLAAPGGLTGPSFDPSRISVAQNGAATTITQTSSRAVVDWQSFDVRPGEAVVFAQPNAQAATLNRVHSAWASSIDGTLTANGRVIIQNGNGVVFGEGARIDVGSLVATTLDVDARQFIDSGELVLRGGTGAGQVRNAGAITVTDRGFVALIGSKVSNDGLIRARLGSVTLAAGSAATIDFAGDGLVQVAITDPVTGDVTGAGALVTNRGHISADGGSVLLTARSARGVMASAINLEGLIEARSVATRAGRVALVGDQAGGVELGAAARIDASGSTGGSVALTGARVNLAGGATIDASASEGGGTILIGGGFRGTGTLAHAREVTVARGATLDASGAAGGGAIIVWSDQLTRFDGTALANATNAGAQGGLVETSSKGRLVVGDDASVSTANSNGASGIWLLDPSSIAIVASGGSASSPDQANNAAGASTINASTVVAALATNRVQLVAELLVSVDAPVVATSLGGSPNGLELIATGADSEIHVNAPILLQDGNLALRAEGNILLGTIGSTETDFARRAIVATGTGTLWMQTRESGNILQADNSAILSQNIAAIGGTVSLASWDNFTLNLAGSARNGNFLFRETNASSASPVGTVVDPFTLQALSGVNQRSKTLLETQKLVSAQAPAPIDNVRTLALTGSLTGQTFDTIVFSALPYEPLADGSSPPLDPSITDSSDYGVRSLTYSIGGVSHTITPETLASRRPAGFQLEAAGGSVIAWTNVAFANQAWGVEGFSGVGGTDPEEIGHDPQQNISENLIVSLGGQTTSVTAAIRLFFAPDFEIPFAEAAQIQYFRTTASAGTVEIRPAALTGTVNSVSRVYGDPNPDFTFAGDGPAYLDVDEFVASQLAGFELPAVEIVTSATPLSPVGIYALVATPPASGFAAQRYTPDFTDGTLTITPAQLTVSADDQSRLYGDPNPPLTSSATGWRNNDDAATSVTPALSTPATVASNVGDYAINVDSASLSGPAAGNYTLNLVDGVLTITPAPLLVTGDAATRIFGDRDPALTFAVDGLRNDDNASAVLTGTLRRVPGEDVGIYAVLQGSLGLTTANYVLTYVDGSLTITPAPLTVRADPSGKIFGAEDPLLTWQVEGLRLGDAIDIVTGQLARDPGEDVGIFTIRQGTIAVASPNYTLDFIEALFVIKPRPGDIGILSSRSFNPWRIRYIERGRDPDTPGDAVYRTTPFENPFIPDPLMRAYGLGDVVPEGEDATDWRSSDNDRVGQHADRPAASPPCPSSEVQAIMVCRAAGFLRDFWTVIK